MCLPPFAPTLIFPSLTLALLSVRNICWHNGLRFQAWVDAVTTLQLWPGTTARRGKACCLDTWERLQSNSAERRQGQRVMFSGTKSSSCHVNGSLGLFLRFFFILTVHSVPCFMRCFSVFSRISSLKVRLCISNRDALADVKRCLSLCWSTSRKIFMKMSN